MSIGVCVGLSANAAGTSLTGYGWAESSDTELNRVAEWTRGTRP